MASSKLEFMVEKINDKETLKEALLNNPGVIKAEIIGTEAVVMETMLPCDAAANLLQKITGGRAVLQGFGEGGAAVVMMGCGEATGIVRLSGASSGKGGLVDGTIDGLPPGKLTLQVHVAGDLSMGCESLGPVWEPVGKLGHIDVGDNGRASFKFVVPHLQVSQVIGRSLSVTTEEQGKRYACGIIARSAGLFENSKKICACDGITLWDERHVPAAGQARRNHTTNASNNSSHDPKVCKCRT